jgi:hypothetical protein
MTMKVAMGGRNGLRNGMVEDGWVNGKVEWMDGLIGEVEGGFVNEIIAKLKRSDGRNGMEGWTGGMRDGWRDIYGEWQCLNGSDGISGLTDVAVKWIGGWANGMVD